MSQSEIERRLEALEQAVFDLQKRIRLIANGEMDPKTQPHWWITHAGRFRNDPDFDEVIRLGREYRDSQNPYKKKKPRKNKPKKHG
jgi:hypothetical protein